MFTRWQHLVVDNAMDRSTQNPGIITVRHHSCISTICLHVPDVTKHDKISQAIFVYCKGLEVGTAWE